MSAETDMQTLDFVSGLTTARILPTPRALISAYANTGKQFSIAFIKQLSGEKRKTLCLGY